jgi:hypothetical protein
MKVIYEKDIKNLEKLQRNTKAINKKLVKITSQVRNDIVSRTRKGKTASGGNAPAYSQTYAAWKQERKQRNVSHRDLTLNGDMLNSMKVRRIPNGAEIYFDKMKEVIKATAHHYGLGQKRFSFFRLSRKNISYVNSELQKDFK